ncbi:MAG TPA: beta-ketoacyl synthase N-terminal-like domain-containing protein, partial [Iamia sp.]
MTGRRRIAVTGTGVVSPAGNDLATTMAGVVAAKATAAPITLFDATNLPVGFACEVADLDVEGRIGAREARRIDRSGHLALIAAADALADAGLSGAVADGLDAARVAVVAGTGIGGLTTLEEQVKLHAERGPEKGPRRVSPMLVPMMMANGPAALVAIANGFTGPCLC